MRKPVPPVGPLGPGSLVEALAAVPDPRQPYGWWPGRSRLPLMGLLRTNRGHRWIENRTHYVPLVTFDDDHSQVCSGAPSRAFAACRNLTMALLRRAGCKNIAETVRSFADRPSGAVALVASAASTW